ncbi:D-alanyl-D-alanine carboxypeptidase, partial [Streptomyces hydrogenans]
GRYPGLIGVKNGYTSNAGNTLVSAARRGDRTLVVSVMNPQSGGGLAVYEEARSLLDWGFEAAGKVRPVGSLLPPKSPDSPSGERSEARAVAVRGGAGAPAAALGASAHRPGTAAEAADRGPSVALPLSLVGSACAAALALWAWRRRVTHG